MHKINVDNIIPGAKLAKSVFGMEGRVLLSSGVLLKENYIRKLKANGIAEVYIEEDLSAGIEVKDVICEDTRIEAKVLIKNLMDNFTISDSINADGVKEIINRIIDELLSSRDILVNLSDIKSVDDYTFEHSVNVCILSLITGIGMGYKGSRLKDLGVGALLHDIGKLKVPDEILKKPSQLTVEEFEEIKKHTIYGYEILKDNPSVSMVSAFIAFGHHERFDGSGYPLQLKGDNIHQCAGIVAVADVYDALTSDRVYRKRVKPHKVVEYITSLSTRHFDASIVENFIKYIAVYPVGTGVMLNTKQIGIVVSVNRSLPTRPVVRIVFDEERKKVAHYYEIDLAKKMNIFVMDAYEL